MQFVPIDLPSIRTLQIDSHELLDMTRCGPCLATQTVQVENPRLIQSVVGTLCGVSGVVAHRPQVCVAA